MGGRGGPVSSWRAGVLWLTGLSGAGKSTIAAGVLGKLRQQGVIVCLLDGDALRSGLCEDLGFSAEDRAENCRRVAHVARLLADSGFLILVAMISPYRADRDRARQTIGPWRFLEVFVDCPAKVCSARDTKGLYAQERRGLLADLTGISSPYEPPLAADLVLHTDRLTVADAVEEAFGLLVERRLREQKGDVGCVGLRLAERVPGRLKG
jgi:adenylylsulfate kinase